MLFATEMKRLDGIQADALGNNTLPRAERVWIICEAERVRVRIEVFNRKIDGKINSLADELNDKF